MRALGTKLALQAALFLLLSSAAVPVRAQNLPPPVNPNNEVDLHVCNKGTVPVEVVTAKKDYALLGTRGTGHSSLSLPLCFSRQTSNLATPCMESQVTATNII